MEAGGRGVFRGVRYSVRKRLGTHPSAHQHTCSSSHERVLSQMKQLTKSPLLINVLWNRTGRTVWKKRPSLNLLIGKDHSGASNDPHSQRPDVFLYIPAITVTSNAKEMVVTITLLSLQVSSVHQPQVYNQLPLNPDDKPKPDHPQTETHLQRSLVSVILSVKETIFRIYGNLSNQSNNGISNK